MTVELFLKNYKSNIGKKTFEDFMTKHITRQYVPYLEKVTYCNAILKASCYTKVGDKEVVKFNSPGQFLGFITRLIALYTDIEIDFNDGKFIEQYDALAEAGAIESIVQYIPEREYSEFETLLNFAVMDLRENEYSTTALLYNIKQSIDLSGEQLIKAIEEISKTEQSN